MLGISLGGMVAQELALAAPQRVSTLTLGCTSCGGTQSKPTAPEVVQRLTAAVLSRDRERMLRTGFELVVSRAYASEPAHYAAFAAAAGQYPASVSVLLAQQAAIEAHDTYARLRGLRVPTLVIHGSADELLAADQRRSRRVADPGRAPGAARRTRASVLLGGAAALGRARAGVRAERLVCVA